MTLNNEQNQLPEGFRTMIEKYEPRFEDQELDNLEVNPEHDVVYGAAAEGVGMLAASMEELGQCQLVICWLLASGKLQIINGARIWSAAQFLGWKVVSIAVLTRISEEEVIPLMHALNSCQRRFSWRTAANKVKSLKAEAKKYLNEAQADDSPDVDLTVRQYTAKLLGLKSENHVSDLEAIMRHPDSNVLIEQLERGSLKIHKAACIARGSVNMPKPKTKNDGDNVVPACDDCPRRKEFLKQLEEDNDVITTSADNCTTTEEEAAHE